LEADTLGLDTSQKPAEPQDVNVWLKVVRDDAVLRDKPDAANSGISEEARKGWILRGAKKRGQDGSNWYELYGSYDEVEGDYGRFSDEVFINERDVEIVPNPMTRK
jgi:hypothetical protein